MKFYINEMNDHTVTLMSEAGYVLAYFPSFLEALAACENWYFTKAVSSVPEIKINTVIPDDYSKRLTVA